MKDWLEKELKFIAWLSKYKNFLGKLKRRDFKDFTTREEALNQYNKERNVS